MKKYLILLGIALTYSNAFSQKETVQHIKADIKSLVIYLEGTEIHRSKTIKLSQGKNKIIFEGLSPKLNPTSIRVATTNDIAVLAISSKINYLTKVEEKPKIKELTDSVKLVNSKNTLLNDELSAYTIEKEMLIKNQSIGGEQNGVSITELKQAADFYRTRIKDINNRISKIHKETNKHNKTLNKLNNQLRELNAEYSYRKAEITVLLQANSSVTATIDLKYLVKDAGWTPIYDIKAKDINNPIELIYRAQVYNNSNIDWKDVKFKLSTGDPSLSATQPDLKPWYLNYDVSTSYTKNEFKLNQGYYQNIIPESQLLDMEVQKKGDEVIYETIEISVLGAEFDIATKYTIPSDNKPYLVDVVEYKLPATYKHFSIPKLDRDAFLLARITGWEDLDLIDGTANVYFGGTYVGKSYINTRNIKDTLNLSLGRDKKVLVTRSKLKEYSKTKFIGGKRKETYAYKIAVKNNHKVPISIEIQDQLPVSQDSEIEVNMIDISDAERNELTGKLIWEFNLEPGKTQKIDLIFSIKYPKSKPLYNLKTPKRSQKMRMF